LLWAFQTVLPTRSPGRTAQVNTIRLGLIKLGARVKQLKNRIRVYRPTADPNQPILRLVVDRLPRLTLLT
jgi:hypothetical protein